MSTGGHLISRALAARMLWRLRKGPVPNGRTFAAEMDCRHRAVGETVQFLRCRGHRINGIAGGGYSLARSLREANVFLRQMWSRIAELRRAVRAMERGRVPQTRVRGTGPRCAA